MNQAGRRCQRSTASSAPNRRWHWWSSSHSRVLGWALDQAASATHPHSPTARWSELTPSLHFTFRHYNHPQHQPQQSSEWYSYSSSAITPLLYTLDRFWFTSVGRQTFVFCAFFFFFFHFIVFHPLAPHAALLEFCSAIPADVSLNQPSPPHCVRRISAGYSAITHRKWYIPPVNHPYVPRVLCSPLCMEWENIGKRVLCSPLLPIDEQTGEWVRGIRVKVRVRVGVHSYTPHPQSHHSEPSPTSNFINLSFPRTPRWRTRVTSGPVAHLLANFFFPAGTKFRTITANVTVTEKPSTCSP